MSTTPQEPDLVHLGTPASEAKLIVYAVHGRGQSPDYMAEIVAKLHFSEVAWFLPSAPEGSWYPQGFMEPEAERHVALEDSLNVVRAHVQALLEHSSSPVVVFGFSQGACLLSEYLLRDRPPVKGAILHTGGYPGNRPRDWNPTPALHGLEVKMLTAAEDDWVPLHRVEETKAAFESLSASVNLTVFDDPVHHISQESLQLICNYLRGIRSHVPSED